MTSSFLVSWLRLAMFQGGGLVVVLATMALAAIHIPPAVYGQYALLLSVVQISSGVALSWLNQSILRFAREEFSRSKGSGQVLATTLLLELGAYGIVLVALWLARPWLGGWMDLSMPVFVALAASLLFLALFEAMSYAAQAGGRFDGYALGQILVKLGPLAAVASIAAGFAADPRLLLWGACLGWCAGAIFTARSLLQLQSQRKLSAWRPSLTVARRVISYGWLLPIASIAGVLVAWMNVWFIRAIAGAAEAGVYWWAYGVFAVGAALLMPLGAVIAPEMIDLRLKDRQHEIGRRIDIIVAAAMMLSALMPAIIAALYLVASLALPAGYAASAAIIALLFVALPAQLVTYASSSLTQAYEHFVPRMVLINVLAALINAAGTLVSVPRVGGIGAAIATVLAVWFAAIATLVVARSVLFEPAPVARALLRVGLAAMAIFACAASMLLVPLHHSVSIGLLGTLVLTAAMRKIGALEALQQLEPHLAILPWSIRSISSRAFLALVRPPPPSRGTAR
jgi:O-antigen/teichoic acid export membrane protein